MSKENPNNPSSFDKESASKNKKVSYSKTRDAIKSKHKPRHFSDAEAEKSYRQMRIEKVRISIRKIKRLNIALTLLTIAILFTMFIGASVIIPRKAAVVNQDNYKDTTLTVDFAGDVMFGRYINDYAEHNGYDSVFEGVAPYFQNADLTFVNLECAVLKDSVSTYTEAKKNIHLYCNYEMLEAAQRAGINVFGTANNHGFDYGNRPVEELIEYFKTNNIYYNGIGMNTNEAAKYTVIDCNGYRIAFIAITDVYYKEACATPDRSGVLATTYGDYNQLVNDASKNSDITIVYFHWGEENELARNKEQIALAHRMIDAGADIIIGAHPHVLQEIEKYKDGIIYYSMGNFIFDQGTTFSRDTVIVEMNLNSKGQPDFTLIPLRINDGAPEVTDWFFYKARINRELTQGLKESDYYTDDDGYIHVLLDTAFTRTAEQRAAAEATEPIAPTTPAAPTAPAASTVPGETQPAAPTEPVQAALPTSAVNEPEMPTLQPAPPKPTQAE